MTVDITEVERRVEGHGLIRSVDRVPRGHVRLETAFLYPDGGSVDVFVVETAPLLKTLSLSDLGQTTSWLLDLQVKPWLSKKRQRFLEDAIRLHGVKQEGGALVKPLASIDDIVEGAVALGQACLRVADLTYTRRSSLQVTAIEEVEELIADTEHPYEANVELEGRRGTKVRVDFLVQGPRVQSAVLTLATGTSSQAHITANEIFRKWYDLDIEARTEQRVTVFDDRRDVYRSEDLKRLGDLSTVVALSDRQSIRDLLAA